MRTEPVLLAPSWSWSISASRSASLPGAASGFDLGRLEAVAELVAAPSAGAAAAPEPATSAPLRVRDLPLSEARTPSEAASLRRALLAAGLEAAASPLAPPSLTAPDEAPRSSMTVLLLALIAVAVRELLLLVALPNGSEDRFEELLLMAARGGADDPLFSPPVIALRT